MKDHPKIPEDHPRFSTDYKSRAMFLVTSYSEMDCAEIKWRRDWKLLTELDTYQRENARCIARCCWEDQGDRVADAINDVGNDDPVRPGDQNAWQEHEEYYLIAKAWKEWQTNEKR